MQRYIEVFHVYCCMGKKIIALLGSPLSDGNTAKLFECALKGAVDAGCTVEKIEVGSLDFQACTEMMFCKDHETCIVDDDMQQIYPKFKEMDGLIIATPIMTMGIPGRLKSMMDRFQVFYMAKYMRKKSFISKERAAERKGLFICISGMKVPEVFVGAKLTVKGFFDTIDCQYTDELLISDMDTIRDVTAHPYLLKAAYEKGYALGRSLTGDTPTQ